MEDDTFRQMMEYPKSPKKSPSLDSRKSLDGQVREAPPITLATPGQVIQQNGSPVPLATSERRTETVPASPTESKMSETRAPPSDNGHTHRTPERMKETPTSRPASEPRTRQQKKAAEDTPDSTVAVSKPKRKASATPAPAPEPPKPTLEKKETSPEEEEWLKAIEQKFRAIAGDDGMINYAEFKKALDSKQEIFVKSYFRLFDEDGSGEIEMEEFMESLRKISQQSNLDKLRFLFGIFDADGDGEITPEELKVALNACISESSLKMTDDKMDQLVGALMKSADVDGDGVITFEELKTQFEKYPMLVENLAVSPSNWLKLHKKPVKPSLYSVVKKSAVNMYANNKPLLGFVIMHALTFSLCFFGSMYKYRKSNIWVQIARGCGMSLNYHAAMLALSMARRSLTFLRNTPIGPYLAVDDHIELHKMLGVATVVLGIVHTIAHLANIVVVVSGGHVLTFSQYLFTHMSGVGWFYGTAYPSGVLLTIILVIMGVCSSPMIRRAGLFEFFYKTHLLYIPFWVLTLLHGPIFWMWFLIPGLMIFCEHSYSHYIHKKQFADKKGFFTTEVNLLPSKVIHLVVTRPKSFKFHAGDYVFLRIPSISDWELHPFSISSAPEEEDIMWIHIRTMGGWTKRLYDLFDKGDYVDSIEEQEEEDCWNCGRIHGKPRGGKCTQPRKRGYTIASRKTMQALIDLPADAADAGPLLGDRVDFPNKEDYMDYLKAAKEELDHEAAAEKLRGDILQKVGAPAPEKKSHLDVSQKGSLSGNKTHDSISLFNKPRKRIVKTSQDLFKKLKENRESQPPPVTNLPNGGRSYVDRRKVFIEGPFGSAAVRMGDTNHAVLVAAGIGVTPFASVLQSLITQHRLARENEGGDQPKYKNSNRLKKIDFVWVNRNADDFDWFLSLLTQLEMEEARQGDFDNFLDMHLYMTAAKSSSDLKGVGLQMALELVHQEDEHDMITGLKTRTQAGRPNWKKLFQGFKEEKHGQVHIYYCGGPALATTLKAECDNIGFQFSLSL